jgi:hypothetical protein
MRHCLSLIALLSLVPCTTAREVDYTRVDRTVGNEPAYQQAPRYALLLFGTEARLRVLVALDGQTVYIDRNADGNLTGKDECFARPQDCKDIEIKGSDGKTRYRINGLSTFKDQAREHLMVDVTINGPLSYQQYCDVELKGSVREARLAHFHGPLTMGPVTINWKVPAGLTLATGEKPTELQGHVGTFSAKHGCWVVVRSHNGKQSAFPEGVHPVVDVQFPPKAAGGPAVKRRYALDQFC